MFSTRMTHGRYTSAGGGWLVRARRYGSYSFIGIGQETGADREKLSKGIKGKRMNKAYKPGGQKEKKEYKRKVRKYIMKRRKNSS